MRRFIFLHISPFLVGIPPFNGIQAIESLRPEPRPWGGGRPKTKWMEWAELNKIGYCMYRLEEWDTWEREIEQAELDGVVKTVQEIIEATIQAVLPYSPVLPVLHRSAQKSRRNHVSSARKIKKIANKSLIRR